MYGITIQWMHHSLKYMVVGIKKKKTSPSLLTLYLIIFSGCHLASSINIYLLWHDFSSKVKYHIDCTHPLNSQYNMFLYAGWGMKVRTQPVVQSLSSLNFLKTTHYFQNQTIWCCPPVTGFDGFNWSKISGRQVKGYRGQGTGLVTRWQWQRWGCHRLLPPGPLPVSCASLEEVLVGDSEEDSWCSLQLAFGSPFLEEWAPSVHLG